MKSYRYRRPSKHHKEDNSHFFGEKEGSTAQQAQGAFFQPKLEIDPANSPAEKEADAAASKAVSHTHSGDGHAKAIQRKKIQRQEKEEEPAAKRIQKQEEEEPKAKLIQRQEREEEPAAKRIQKQEEEEPKAKLIQRQEKEEEPAAKLIQKQEEEEPKAKLIQRQEKEEEPAAKLIQRQSLPEEEMQKKAAPGPPGKKTEATPRPSLEDQIKKTKGGGMPLPEALRTEMEKEFGADFSQVRIHTGADAVEMTQAMHAHAFTHGYDIYFNESRFDPDSKNGKELLAHELAHVVQQKGT